MNRENLSKTISDIDDRFVAEAYRYDPEKVRSAPERIVHMKSKRIITFALAAALLLSVGLAAYAISGIHQRRQQELRAELKIEENKAGSYVEYALEEEVKGAVILSAVNNGEEQRVFVNVAPVTEEELRHFPGELSFGWRIEGSDLSGFAAPQLKPERSVSGKEAIYEAVREDAYDAETRTLTLECYLPAKKLNEIAAQQGSGSVQLTLLMSLPEQEPRAFGSVPFTPTEEERRVFDFQHARYYDAALDKEIEILALELTPFSAVWRLHYEGDEAFHQPGADWDAYRDWSILEDKVCIETQIIFSDGSSFSTGGALTTPYENGTVNSYCGWAQAINIQDVQRIVLGDLVLWEKP